MKGLDTPVLLALLAGRASARALFEGKAEEELCTTEINLFELEAIARASPSGGRARRLAALERLRHRITVLPLDDRGAKAAALLASTNPAGVSSTGCLVAGCFLANGASELVTTEGAGIPATVSGVKVTLLRNRHAQGRKSRK